MSSDAHGARTFERAARPLRVVVGIVLFALVIVAVVRGWDEVRTTLTRISPFELVLAEALVLAGLAASVLTWRVAMQELGSLISAPSASKIYLLGQLGKYLPGSVWALAAQMELARDAGVPRVRAIAAGIVAIGVNVVTGLAVGLALLPGTVTGGTWRVLSLVVVLAAAAITLSPPMLTRLVDYAARLLRRPPLEHAIAWPGILTATLWSLVSWACYGMSLWILAVAVGAAPAESLPLSFAGIALAMTLGFLVIVAPSGIGVREAVIVAALAPVVERPSAFALALVVRLLFTVADLVAAVAVVPIRIRPATPAP